MCGDPETIANGSLQFSSVSFGSIATYTCDFGFLMSGYSTSICVGNKQWSHSPPACQGMNVGISTPHLEHTAEGPNYIGQLSDRE